MKIVAIEANIGAGKSTLLNDLKRELELWSGDDWQVLIEPVDEDPEFQRLLKVYISNPHVPEERIKFQKYLTNQRQMMLKDIPDGNYIIERSLFSDIVFCQLNFLTMERPDASYMDYFYNIKERLKDYPRIDAIIYLDKTPESCLKSIKKRGRDGEDAYELDYIKDVKLFHDACLPQIAREYNTELIKIDLEDNYAVPSMVAVEVMEAVYGKSCV